MEEHTEEPVLLDRSSRKTRGKRSSFSLVIYLPFSFFVYLNSEKDRFNFIFDRIKNLIDEEIEQDDQFWNQDALKEVFIYFFLILDVSVTRRKLFCDTVVTCLLIS